MIAQCPVSQTSLMEHTSLTYFGFIYNFFLSREILRITRSALTVVYYVYHSDVFQILITNLTDHQLTAIGSNIYQELQVR